MELVIIVLDIMEVSIKVVIHLMQLMIEPVVAVATTVVHVHTEATVVAAEVHHIFLVIQEALLSVEEILLLQFQ